MTTGFVLLYAVVMLTSAEPSSVAMAKSAEAFLASLTPGQRAQATFGFDSDERMRWHFIPFEMFPRKGLTIKEMTEPQRRAAHALIKTGLSQRGYMTATAIMDLENVLNVLEAAQRQANGGTGTVLVRDPERYFVSVFGSPSTRDNWGWRVEGHHVSLQFTVVKGSLVASSPTFFGSNPAEVREGPKKGLRVLGAQEDAARTLLASLDDSQRTRAILSPEAPNDIQTMATNDITPLAPAGITSDALTAKQKQLLMSLIDVYTGVMAPDLASARRQRLERAGLERIGFAWLGDTTPGKKHYYRVQGPTFLVEYDNTQNNGNHVHSVWRDFQGDFGRDLLREHLKTAAH